MPPRHTYWTILFGDKPTAFRSATQEELLPTFKQIQGKHPDAVMMWFARGKLWRTEEEARAVFDRPRGDFRKPPAPERRPGGAGDAEGSPKPRGGDWRERPREDRPRGPRPEWRDKPHGDRPPSDRPKPPASARRPSGAGYGGAPPKPHGGEGGPWQNRGPKPEWREKPREDRPRDPRPEWRDKPHGDRPPSDRPKPPASARRPSGAGYGGAPPKPHGGEGGAWQNRGPKPEWRDKPQGDRPRGPRPEWRDKPQGDRPPSDRPKPAWQNRGPKPEWRDKPAGDRPRGPKPDGPKPPGGGPASDRPLDKDRDKPLDEARDRRGRDWRPGGQHKDPRDRFKVPRDVKRARFKQNLQRERTSPRPPRKKKDEE